MSTDRTPVVFVHGLWLHSDSWGAWVDLFDKAGYEPSAPGWPDDPASVAEARANPDRIAGHGIDQVTDHYAQIIRRLNKQPIVIGHSFGGLIVQKLLGENLASAAVAIDPAPIKGVLRLPASALRSAFPVLKNPANRNRAISLTPRQFRYGFGNALSAEESDDLHQRWTIPAPGKPLFQAATANLSPSAENKVDTRNSMRGPLLLTGGGQDRTVPMSLTTSTAKQYRKSPAITDVKIFADRGHSLTIDHGWRDVADACLEWLRKHSLT